MQLVKIKKDVIINNSKTLKSGKIYLMSDLTVTQLSTIHSDSFGISLDFKSIFKPYRGQALNGKKLLIFRTGGAGDILFATVGTRLIKEKFPGVHIIFATSNTYIDLIKYNPYISVIHSMPLNLEVLHEADYHVSFENVIENSKLAEQYHAVDLFLTKFFINPSEIKSQYKKPDLFISNGIIKEVKTELTKKNILQNNYTVIGIQINTSSPIRTFPVEKITKLMVELINRDCYIVIFGGPRQIPIVNNIIDYVKDTVKKDYMVINGPECNWSFQKSSAYALFCNVIIAPDSVMAHVAGAMEIPLIGLYGPFPSNLRMKYYDKAIGIDANVACSPCFTHGHNPCRKGAPSPCFSVIDVDLILASINLLLKRQNIKLKNTNNFCIELFSNIKDQVKEFMIGDGLDIGCGFCYNINTKRLDINPVCEPDILANYNDVTLQSKFDFIICSYVINTKDELTSLLNFCKKYLKKYLILNVGDGRITKNITKPIGCYSNFIKEFLISELTLTDIKEVLSKNMNLIYKNEIETPVKELNFHQDSFNVLTVWEINN